MTKMKLEEKTYSPKTLESKWQEIWEANDLYKFDEEDKTKENYYSFL